jgi:ribosomal protein S18 acetylase RimI-like enzyme
MIFRKIEPKDVAELFNVRIATRENTMTMAALADMGITPESTTQALSCNISGWLCEVAGKIVGFSMGDKNTGEMLVVAVLPEFEKRGIGKQLMELIQGWLFSNRHEELWLLENSDPNIRAYGFYRRLGWVPASFHESGHQILKLYKKSEAKPGPNENREQGDKTIQETELRIRPFVEHDRVEVIALWEEAFADDPPWNAPQAVIGRKLTVQPQLFLVGELEGKVVATVLAGFDGVRGWIHHLAVVPSLRRRGIATQMMREAESGLAKLGCPKVNLQVRPTNANVVAFYQSIGYQVEERVSMGKRLKS